MGFEQFMPQPHALAQLVNGPMANHPDVGFRNAQETGDIRAGLLVVESLTTTARSRSFRF